MNRKAPGTTRSSLPTLQRRRNTTIPGISRRVVVAAFVVVVFHPISRRPRVHLTRESPREWSSPDLSDDRGKWSTTAADDADVGVARRADVRTDNDGDPCYRFALRCPSLIGKRCVDDDDDTFLLAVTERAPMSDATSHRAARPR